MESQGLPVDHDMFSTGDTPHGCGHALRTHINGLRTTSADFITKKNARSNIDIVTEAHVDKVIFDEDLRATGVRAVLADGTTIETKADREVIISGGAYCSPNILNRSGIGAKDELEKHGITTLVDLPGVGKNLMDHLVSLIITFAFDFHCPSFQCMYTSDITDCVHVLRNGDA